MDSGKQQNTIPTKERIFNASVKLFSEKGYAGVSMREIAKMSDITVAGIYNHYASKEDILYSLYDFYADHWKQVCPNTEDLLAIAETGTPAEVFGSLAFHFDPALENTMDLILKIAVGQIGFDERSEAFVNEHCASKTVMVAILDKLVELGKIEPLDTQCFATVLIMFNVATAALNSTSFKVNRDEWQRSFAMIFDIIKIKDIPLK